MRKHGLKHAVGILLALAASLVFWFLLEVRAGLYAAPAPGGERHDPLPGFLAVLIAVLVEVGWLQFMNLLERAAESKTSRAEAAETKATLERVQADSAELLRILGDRIEHDRDAYYVLRAHKGQLTKDQMTEIWLYLLNRLNKYYYATNFIDSEKIYTTPWGRAALMVQTAKYVESNVFIRKVFLIKSPDEIVVLSQHLEEQREAGIDIRYLPIEEVEKDPELSHKYGKDKPIPSIDFGILDARIVLVWELDEATREVKGGRTLLGELVIDQHQQFFDALYKKAKAFCANRFELVLLGDRAKSLVAQIVTGWDEYTGEYANLDYALRFPKGWFYTFGQDANCKAYGAYDEGALVGFSFLVQPSPNAAEAEFYVGVHPNHLNDKHKRYGRRITEKTLRIGFEWLDRIYLKVREEPKFRVELYEKAGFVKTTLEAVEETIPWTGEKVKFHKMEITKARY
jgi:hypothetical protein